MGAGTIYPCGCSIESSMFGKREILSVNPCQKHITVVGAKSKEQIAKNIIEVQKQEQRGS